MFKNELAFKDHYNGMSVAEMLLDEDYVVLLSYEDDLLIVNYEWSEHNADRNDVVFMSRYEYDTELETIYKEMELSLQQQYGKEKE